VTSPHLLRRALAPLALLTAATLAVTACGSASVTAASVNGHVISDKDVLGELRQISANAAYVAAVQQNGATVAGKGNGTFDLSFTDKVLTRQILLELVHEEVVRRKLVITAADLQDAQASQSTQIGNDTQSGKPIFASFSKAYQDLLTRRAAEVTALQDALAGVVVNDATIQRYYAAHTSSYQLNCVSVIQLNSQATADQAHAKAVVPGADFAALARQVSTDAQSAAQGGAIGCQPPGSYSQLAGVDDAIAALTVGGVSKVISVQGAFAIFKLTDRKAQPLTDVRSQVVSALHSQGSTQFNQFVQAQVQKAKVTVGSQYGTWVSTGQNPGVVPPNAPPASAGGSATTVAPGIVTPGTAPPGSTPGTAPPGSTPGSAPPTTGP
jgi:parvulin-like peptidyl-prolyl isomerase